LSWVEKLYLTIGKDQKELLLLLAKIVKEYMLQEPGARPNNIGDQWGG